MEQHSSQQVKCMPISSLEELLDWDKDKTAHCPAKLHKAPLVSFDANGKQVDDTSPSPRLLVCHDMKGGYIEDSLYGGHGDPSAYTFYRWPVVDEFVYFSHELVTVPPCGWVDAAHTHGVAIYGTLITESAAGAEICRRLLHSEQTVDAAIDRLVAISLHHGLDGWLVNIENPIDSQQLPTLRYLVRHLTERMHHEIAHSRVIWYDSVTRDGELSWQDQLNEKNECFFSLCDGIFLNYCWTPVGLASSRERAGPRRRDVYVGVDVFGRGCPGGGGFNALQPVAESRWLGLSAALFAPGWTHEKLGRERFSVAEDVLWSRLSLVLGVSGPARLPLITTFCQGRGLRHYTDGQVSSERPWHRLSAQQRQPSHLQRSGPADLVLMDGYGRPVPTCPQLSCPAALQPPKHESLTDRSDGRAAEQRKIETVCAAGQTLLQPGWQVYHTMEDGFSGGGCLVASNQTDRGAVFRLFSCDLELGDGPSPLAVVYAVKPSGDTSADDCALCVDVADTAEGTVSRLVLRSADAELDTAQPALSSGVSRLLCLGPLPADQLRDGLPSDTLPGPAQCGWYTRHYQPPVSAGPRSGRVCSVGVYLAAHCSVLLGYLALQGARTVPGGSVGTAGQPPPQQ